ncbi:transcriptional regulator BetI [Pararhizobium haloflavum]|uniref:transcriptional regulator BetI n=1 Tax=Pararhizobium haloflavum TaxID=2037914 RepID=UPI000C1A4FBF|nr:transcriptional regulator BetI [Pararhizobium haloflavum]
MPKIGMEPIRRQALIDAAVEEIGVRGGLDVTVGQIARRAGVSAALAHHYFGNKEQILIATMRHLLREFGNVTKGRLSSDQSPRERLSTIISSSFGSEQFRDAAVSAWLAFYVEARRSDAAFQLLQVYTKRLKSNLVYALRPLSDRPTDIAETIGALIDGLYIRHALKKGRPEPREAVALIEAYIDTQLTEKSV